MSLTSLKTPLTIRPVPSRKLQIFLSVLYLLAIYAVGSTSLPVILQSLLILFLVVGFFTSIIKARSDGIAYKWHNDQSWDVVEGVNTYQSYTIDTIWHNSVLFIALELKHDELKNRMIYIFADQLTRDDYHRLQMQLKFYPGETD